MRLYPRSLIKDGVRVRVFNEIEEYELGLKGYERHKNPEINALQKGTDKEVLRVDPRLKEIKKEPEIVVLKEVKKRRGK